MTIENYPDLTGFIFDHFSHDTKCCWKITGPARLSLGSYSYPVIKCSSNGKEFKHVNGYAASFICKLLKEGKLRKSIEDGKASTDGLKSGARKRRIGHLTKTITKMVDELNSLLEQESKTEVYEILVKK